MGLLQSERSEVVVWPMNLVFYMRKWRAWACYLFIVPMPFFAFKAPVACMPLAQGQGLGTGER